MSELINLSVVELSDGVDRGEFTYAEIMAASLDRIDEVNPQINAIVSLQDRDALLKQAQDVADKPKRSKLHGLPIAIKDLMETKGIRTTFGSPIYKDLVPAADAVGASHIRDAGLIVIGKTNTPEFGLGSHSYNPVHGVTRNPYDLSKSAGGSSGGATAALASRMVPIADGSDMMGSLRNPAAWCNVYGLRPTIGLVPDGSDGDLNLSQLATLGPMARDIEDLALMLDVLAPRTEGQSFFEGLNTTVAPCRIGWLGDWNGRYQIEGDILDVCQTGMRVLEELGHSVEQVTLDFDPDKLWMSWVRLRNVAMAAKLKGEYENPETRKLLKPEMIYEIEAGLALSGQEIADATAARTDWFKYLSEVYQSYDAIALPSAQVMPFEAELDWPKNINGQTMTTYHNWMEIVIPASLIGLPALNLPAGFSSTGLPVGFQLMGPRGADAKLLSIGQAYHDATLWPQKHPPQL